MSKFLVTGGCGFIGSHIVDYLCKNNHKVTVIDDESGEQVYKNKKAKYHKLCITDPKTKKLYKDVDCVFHMAAKARIQKCIADPFETYRTNYTGTLSVLEFSKFHKVKKIIFSSTSSIYGNNKSPQKESDEPDCLNPYALSKLNAESLCKNYSDLYDLNIIILRYFNVYGPRESKKGPYASVLGIFNRQKIKNKPLTIVGDGSQKRDFISVYDVVGANFSAYKCKKNFNIINVGSGKNHSILQIAKMISDNYVFLPKRPGESKETLADIAKLKNILKYNIKCKIEDYIKNLGVVQSG